MISYNETKSKFNIELPEYAKHIFDNFIEEYDSSRSILSDSDIDFIIAKTKLPTEAATELKRIAKTINENPEAHLLASFTADFLVYKRAPWLNFINDCDLFPVNGIYPEQLGWIFVAIRMADTLKNKNVPTELNEENIGAFNWYSQCCKRDKGYWGITEWTWSLLSAGGCMFVFGTLKFCPSEFTGDFIVITNGSDYVSLAANPYFIGHEGELVDSEEKSIGKTSFYEDDSKYIGNIISKNGTVDTVTTVFNKAVWRDFLRESDHTIDIHIPPNIDYNIESMKRDFTSAIKFYKNYYPDHQTKAIVGYSWIFSPQLKKVLAKDSKILAVNKELHILPCFGSFGADCQFIRKGSSLQNRIADKCENGTEFHYAIMYCPISEIY